MASIHRRPVILAVPAMVFNWLLGPWSFAGEPASKPDAAAPAAPKPRPKITVSKETTFVLGPLGDNGSVDFVAAWNELAGKGVTRENNAAVLFWQAIGPKPLPEKCRAEFFKLLGIEPLGEHRDYFVPLIDFVKQHSDRKIVRPPDMTFDVLDEKTSAEEDEASQRPWSKQEFPLLADWLTANERPLDRLAQGMRRERFFSPICRDKPADDLLADSHFRMIGQSRDLARALKFRAMLRLQAGRAEDAFEDALTCHRFASFIGRGPLAIDGLVGFTLDSIASSIDLRIAEHGRLSAEQAAKMAGELGKVFPCALAENFRVGERLWLLDIVCKTAADFETMVKSFWRMPDGSHPIDQRTARLIELVAKNDVDWDAVLRMINLSFDRAVNAFSKPTYRERKQSLAEIKRQIEATSGRAAAAATADKPSGAELSREVEDYLVLQGSSNLLFTGADIQERQTTWMMLAKLAYAIAAYHTENGRFPEKLDNLAPKYQAVVPTDPFIEGQPLHYRPDASGYLLYSVGPDGKDSGGRDPWDDHDSDDIAVQVPYKPSVNR